jgi:hypothetical protein
VRRYVGNDVISKFDPHGLAVSPEDDGADAFKIEITPWGVYRTKKIVEIVYDDRERIVIDHETWIINVDPVTKKPITYERELSIPYPPVLRYRINYREERILIGVFPGIMFEGA